MTMCMIREALVSSLISLKALVHGPWTALRERERERPHTPFIVLVQFVQTEAFWLQSMVGGSVQD